jgi:hypothetical protein
VAGCSRSPAVVPLVPKRYAAGLEIHCPGGALYQTGPCNSQQLNASKVRATTGSPAAAGLIGGLHGVTAPMPAGRTSVALSGELLQPR